MAAIGCDYEDADDLDLLRNNLGIRLACGRLLGIGGDLFSQPTTSPWEIAPILSEGMCMTYGLVDPDCTSYSRPPQYPEWLDPETRLEPLLVDGALGPNEIPRVVVLFGKEAFDVGNQFRHASERPALARLSGQDRKPELDLVHPRLVRWGVEEVHIAMPELVPEFRTAV